MSKVAGTGYNRSQIVVVLALLSTYVFFVLSYVWHMPNYNLLKTGGSHSSGTHIIVKTGIRQSSNYVLPIDKGVWLEKVSKTTPETKRGISLVVIGTVIILSSVFASACMFSVSFTPTHQQRRGFTIFSRQYAYLSLRTLRI